MPSFHAEKCRRLVSIHEASVRARLCSSIPPVPDLYYTVYLFMKTGRADMQTAKQTLTSNTIQTLLQADKHHCYIIIQSRFHSQSFVQRRKIALFNASALHCSCCPAQHGARWPYVWWFTLGRAVERSVLFWQVPNTDSKPVPVTNDAGLLLVIELLLLLSTRTTAIFKRRISVKKCSASFTVFVVPRLFHIPVNVYIIWHYI